MKCLYGNNYWLTSSNKNKRPTLQRVKNLLEKNSDFMKRPKYRILTISCKFLQKILVYIKQYTFIAILPKQEGLTNPKGRHSNGLKIC